MISRQIAGTRFAAGVQRRLAQMQIHVLHSRLTQRIAYTEAVSAGLSVLDYAPTSAASQEVQQLTQEIIAFHAKD